MYIALQREEREIETDVTVMEQVFQYFLVDAIWSQYIMALPNVYEVSVYFYRQYLKYIRLQNIFIYRISIFGN